MFGSRPETFAYVFNCTMRSKVPASSVLENLKLDACQPGKCCRARFVIVISGLGLQGYGYVAESDHVKSCMKARFEPNLVDTDSPRSGRYS